MGKIDISTNEYMREPARVADLLCHGAFGGAAEDEGEVSQAERREE